MCHFRHTLSRFTYFQRAQRVCNAYTGNWGNYKKLCSLIKLCTFNVKTFLMQRTFNFFSKYDACSNFFWRLLLTNDPITKKRR